MINMLKSSYTVCSMVSEEDENVIEVEVSKQGRIFLRHSNNPFQGSTLLPLIPLTDLPTSTVSCQLEQSSGSSRRPVKGQSRSRIFSSPVISQLIKIYCKCTGRKMVAAGYGKRCANQCPIQQFIFKHYMVQQRWLSFPLLAVSMDLRLIQFDLILFCIIYII